MLATPERPKEQALTTEDRKVFHEFVTIAWNFHDGPISEQLFTIHTKMEPKQLRGILVKLVRKGLIPPTITFIPQDLREHVPIEGLDPDLSGNTYYYVSSAEATALNEAEKVLKQFDQMHEQLESAQTTVFSRVMLGDIALRHDETSMKELIADLARSVESGAKAIQKRYETVSEF